MVHGGFRFNKSSIEGDGVWVVVRYSMVRFDVEEMDVDGGFKPDIMEMEFCGSIVFL